MENNIDVDFSKLEKGVAKKSSKTVWAVLCASLILIAFAVVATYTTDICSYFILLYLILACSLVVLCFILHKVESIQTEETKADAALRRKLAEEAIMREIKIREKEISDAQKEINNKSLESELSELKN